jgi:hypothetical protein
MTIDQEKEIVFTTVPWTDTGMPLMAPAILKSIALKAGRTAVTVDLNRKAIQLLSQVDYKNDLVGLIKKASQTYLAGYFVFQIQHPICYHFLGPESLAKLGFTQTIANMMLGIPVVWISMNFPNFSYLIANNKIHEARKEFVTKWQQSLLMTCLAFVFTILGLEILRKLDKFDDRILDIKQILILVTSLTLHAISMGMIYWPRSFKVEPFTRIAYIQMILTPIAFYAFVKYAGLDGAVWANMLTWLVGFVGISLISRNYWKMQQAHAS